MIFGKHSYNNAFYPHQIRLSRANGAFLQADIDRLRERLAEFILSCARQGEFDPEKLKDRALRALLGTAHLSSPGGFAEATQASRFFRASRPEEAHASRLPQID